MAETAAPTKPTINTAEDAAVAYMRGEITENELREACNRFGVVPGQFMAVGPRPDAAFENKLPDDLFKAPASPEDTLEYRQKVAEIKQKARDDSTAAAEEAAEETPESALAAKQAELAQAESEALAKAAEEATPTDSSSSSTATPTKSTATTTKSTSA